MAGSYKHATEDDGTLRDNESFVDMVDTLGDAYETAEQMYGMIWYLATREQNVNSTPIHVVEEARKHYKEGLEAARMYLRTQ